MSTVMPFRRCTVLVTALALSLSLAALAGNADAAVKAPKPHVVPHGAKKMKHRPPVAVTARDGQFVFGNPMGLTGAFTGCTAPSRQSAGWWYRRCGVDWSVPFGGVALLQYQHQFYGSNGWTAYSNTWCRPYGSCVRMQSGNPDVAYSFFYQ